MGTLLREEPFVSILTAVECRSSCWACFQSPPKLAKCSNCKIGLFCNRTCQTSGWSDHKLECPSLLKCPRAMTSDMIRFIGRLIRKLASPKAHEQSGRDFNSLMSHKTDILKDEVRMKKFRAVAKYLKEYLEPAEIPTEDTLLELYGKTVINSLEIFSYNNMRHIGKGMYLSISAIDHSCVPNATVVFDGKTAILSGLVTGLSNQPAELKINYCLLFNTSTERQSLLNQNYYFHCKCPSCSDGERDAKMASLLCPQEGCGGCVVKKQMDDRDYYFCLYCDVSMDKIKVEMALTKMDEAKRVHKQLLEQCTSGKKAEVGPKLLAVAEKCLKSLRLYLHPLNLHRFRVSDFAFDVAAELGIYDSAVNYGKEILPAYKEYYPENHPTVSSLMMNLGKMMGGASMVADAFTLLKQAGTSLKLTHGMQHNLYEEVVKDMKQMNQFAKMMKVFGPELDKSGPTPTPPVVE